MGSKSFVANLDYICHVSVWSNVEDRQTDLFCTSNFISRHVCVVLHHVTSPVSLRVERNRKHLRTFEITWHSGPLTRDFSEPPMTTMTFGKRWEQLSMTSI